MLRIKLLKKKVRSLKIKKILTSLMKKSQKGKSLMRMTVPEKRLLRKSYPSLKIRVPSRRENAGRRLPERLLLQSKLT